MKGLLCAGLLASLRFMDVAQAYEADIHYSTTYVLARAVGWAEADALTIASANQAVDENLDTVAALEVHATPHPSLTGDVTRSMHQAEKNLHLHCFSNAHGPADRISPDVLEVMTRHFSRIPVRGESARSHTRKLIALGVALHCQQDAFSHVGFGGSCGSHPGSCSGHAYETLLDQVVFRMTGKHYFNPDHPGVSGRWLPGALQGTARELAAHRPRAAARQIPARSLAALADALRRSGLDLPDDVRRECNRYIAGKWLFDLLHSGSRTPASSGRLARVTPKIASQCRQPALASATIVRIPEPRFPRLNADASAFRISADGTYQILGDGTFQAASGVRADTGVDTSARHPAVPVTVQLSHWTQLFAARLSE